jgi:dTDP-4-amino-4,6-dideoxygalactose transaminase
MKKKNIFLNIHYIPINLHPFYKRLKVKKNDIVNWINFSRQTISLPIFYDLKLSTQKKILSFIKQFITINKL